jgi:hypothetical protein
VSNTIAHTSLVSESTGQLSSPTKPVARIEAVDRDLDERGHFRPQRCSQPGGSSMSCEATCATRGASVRVLNTPDLTARVLPCSWTSVAA